LRIWPSVSAWGFWQRFSTPEQGEKGEEKKKREKGGETDAMESLLTPPNLPASTDGQIQYLLEGRRKGKRRKKEKKERERKKKKAIRRHPDHVGVGSLHGKDPDCSAMGEKGGKRRSKLQCLRNRTRGGSETNENTWHFHHRWAGKKKKKKKRGGRGEKKREI